MSQTSYQFILLGPGDNSAMLANDRFMDFLNSLPKDAVTLRYLMPKGVLCCGGYGYRVTVNDETVHTDVKNYLRANFCRGSLETITVGHNSFSEENPFFHRFGEGEEKTEQKSD